MTPAGRQRLLAAALLATLVAAWLAPESPQDGGAAVAALAPMPDLLDWPEAPEMPAIASASDSTLDAADEAPVRSGKGRQAKGSPEQASQPGLVPVPPFRMFGRLERDGEALAFISHAGRTLTAGAGDQLPGDWQVDSVGSDGVVLTYLPLGQTALIPFKTPAK
jgi:hypothetical protein